MTKRILASILSVAVVLVVALAFLASRSTEADASKRTAPSTAKECVAKGGYWQQSGGFYGCFPPQPSVEDGGSASWQGPRS